MIDHELTDPAGGALTMTHDHQGVWVTATVDRDEVTVGPFPARALRASFDMGDDLMDGGVTAAAIENEAVSPERARPLVQERDEALTYAAEAIAAAQAEATAAVTAQEKAELDRDGWQTAYKGATFRREEAEKERDNLQESYTLALKYLNEAQATIASLRTENPRPEKYDAHAEAAEKVGALLRARTVDLVEALAERDKARRERDHAHKSLKESDAALREMRENPRPLTADDRARAFRAFDEVWCIAGPTTRDAVNAALDAALTSPPSRPEGAEEIQTILMSADMEGGEAYRTDGYTGMADFLAERGVRVVTEEQP